VVSGLVLTVIAVVAVLGCSSGASSPSGVPRGNAGAMPDDAMEAEGGVQSTPERSGSAYPPGGQSADASVNPLAAGTTCPELSADYPDICTGWAPHFYDCYPNQSLPKGLDEVHDCYRFADLAAPAKDDWKCCSR
jgi:hypothetical protein